MKTEYVTRNGRAVVLTGDQEVTDYEPHFYVHRDAQILADKRILRTEDKGYVDIFGTPLIKIITMHPSHVPELRTLFPKTWEADIPFTNRFLIDNPQPPQTLRHCILDIETGTKGVNKKPNPRTDFVSCLTCHDTKTNQSIGFYHHTKSVNLPTKTIQFRNEKDMLNKFLGFIQHCDFDSLISYNTKFDIIYLIQRMEAIGLDANRLSNPKLNYARISEGFMSDARVGGRYVFDFYHHYRKITLGELDSYKLKNVCKTEGIDVDYDYIPDDFYEAWLNDIHNLVKYNIEDVKALVELEKKVGVISYHKNMADFIGCELDNVKSNSMIADFYILKKAHERGIILPSKITREKEPFEGALVLEPIKGLHYFDMVFDFSKMYPNIVKTFNLSPETKNKPGITVNGISWSREPGFFPSIITELFGYRDAVKREMHKPGIDPNSESYKLFNRKQTSIKFLTNTISYGYFSDYKSRARLYDIDIAKTITFVERTLMDALVKELISLGYTVTGGDTDSVFVKSNSPTSLADVIAEGKELNKHINVFINNFIENEYDVTESTLSMEFEKIYKAHKILAKKRYVGWKVWADGKECDVLEIKGIEQKRKGDNSIFTREMQYKCANMLVREGALNDELIVFKMERIEAFPSQPYTTVGIPQTLTKKIGEYGFVNGKPKHPEPKVQGAKWANVILNKDYGAGSRFYMLYVSRVIEKSTNRDMPLNRTATGIGVICFDENKDLEPYKITYHPHMLNLTVKGKIDPFIGDDAKQTNMSEW